MKTIIAGMRDPKLNLSNELEAAIKKSGFRITEVVSGCATGVDELGELWARRNQVPLKMFPADWQRHGRAAGPIRNRQMAEYADALIAVWDGKSRGTKNMIETAAGLQRLAIYVYRTDKAAGKPLGDFMELGGHLEKGKLKL